MATYQSPYPSHDRKPLFDLCLSCLVLLSLYVVYQRFSFVFLTSISYDFESERNTGSWLGKIEKSSHLNTIIRVVFGRGRLENKVLENTLYLYEIMPVSFTFIISNNRSIVSMTFNFSTLPSYLARDWSSNCWTSMERPFFTKSLKYCRMLYRAGGLN